MNKVFPTACLLCFFQLLSVYTLAQSIRVLSTKDGLPQSFVSGLEQDEQGFIWIGTRNGLVRYDGTQFVSFQHNINNPASVASNIVNWLSKDKSNHIWIEYESGEIDVIDPASQQIQHVVSNQSKNPLPVFIRRGWLFTSKGIFVSIKTSVGLNSYDTATKQLQLLTPANSHLPSVTVNGLMETNNGQIWVVSPTAISLLNDKTKHFTNFAIPFQLQFTNIYSTDDQVIDMHERSNGELMWAMLKDYSSSTPKPKHFAQLICRSILCME